jgi:hypothetical protein
MIVITTPRPPLNLFNVDRIEVPSFWTTILDVPEYFIPGAGPRPPRTVKAVALLTSLMISNNSTDVVQISMQVVDNTAKQWLILNEMDIPPNDFAVIDLGKQNLQSGEKLRLRTQNFQGAIAQLSYVLNQREEFVVLP